MAINTPTMIPRPWAESGTKETIPDTTTEKGRASWTQGFPPITATTLAEGGIPPRYNDFQGVLNTLSEHAFFEQSGSVYPWNASLDYIAGAHVQGSDGIEYIALLPSGPKSGGAFDPTIDSGRSTWQQFNSVADIPVIKNSIEEVAAEDRDGLYWVPEMVSDEPFDEPYVDAAIEAHNTDTDAHANLHVTATGSTDSRAITDRFSDIINVKDYGAVGDGTTDDTTAIQAAFDTGLGPVIFPQGKYKITKTISINASARQVVDFCRSIIYWYGDSGGTMFEVAGGMKTLENGYLYGRAIAKEGIHLTATQSRVVNTVIRDCSDGALIIGSYDGSSSFNAQIDKVHIYKYLGEMSAEDGSGIIIHEPDNKLTNVVIIGYKTSVYQRTHGNLFSNCHFCCQFSTPDEDGKFASYGVYFDPKSSSRVYCDKYTNIYFDNHKYCFYAASKNTSRVDVENSFYFNSSRQVATGIVFNAFLTGGYAIPITSHNFTIAVPNRCIFIDSVLSCIKSDIFTECGLIDTSYNRSEYSGSNSVPYSANFKTENNKPVMVINTDYNINADTDICVGAVVSPFSNSACTRNTPIEISGWNRCYSFWKVILTPGVTTGTMYILKSEVYKKDSLFTFKVGSQQEVTLNGQECTVWPIYLTPSSDISNTVFYMSSVSHGLSHVYLVNNCVLNYPSTNFDVVFTPTE